MSRAQTSPAKSTARRIPPINQLAEAAQKTLPQVQIPHHAAVRLARLAATAMREDSDLSQERAIARVCDTLHNAGPRAVINATGILLHTNLGRAPLPPELITQSLKEVQGYTDLEFDLRSGKRGHRDRHFAQLARLVWGVEDATLVNNAAAAVTLAVAALATDRETIVSRGELIEIGGSFRLPDILELAGTRLVEVGTTNKTKLADYRNAINENTGCLLKTHPSNYRIEGFTQDTSLDDLCKLGQEIKQPVIMDLGGGLSQHLPFPKIDEPFIEDYIKAQPDLLIFSGDKLFGSIQGGIILGKAEAIQKVRKHPMMRMLRADKLSISILCRQLQHTFLEGQHPFAQLAATSLEERRQRAHAMVKKLSSHLQASVQDSHAFMGGGSLPQEKRASIAISLQVEKPAALAKKLRLHTPAIVGYVRDERLWIDLGTVFPEQDAIIVEALASLA